MALVPPLFLADRVRLIFHSYRGSIYLDSCNFLFLTFSKPEFFLSTYAFSVQFTGRTAEIFVVYYLVSYLGAVR